MTSQPTPIQTPTRRQDGRRRLSLSLDSATYEALRGLAEDTERSLAGFVRYVLRRVTDDLEGWDKD